MDYIDGNAHRYDKHADMLAEEQRKKKIEKMLKELENERKNTEKLQHLKKHHMHIRESSPTHHYAKNEKPHNTPNDEGSSKKDDNFQSINKPEPSGLPKISPNLTDTIRIVKKYFILTLILLVCLFFIYAALSPFIGFSIVDNSSIVNDARNAVLDWKNTVYHTKNCTSTIQNDQCLISKPLYCSNGEIVNNSERCGCEKRYRPYQKNCIETINCSDGSLSPDCSSNKPFQCQNGSLISKASLCGCPDDYIPENDTCKKIERCVDGTIYGQCSRNQPLYCKNGSLINQASKCGCPEGLSIESIGNTNGERCVINRAFGASKTSGSTSIANLYDVETRVHILINAQRDANGLSALNFDEKLASIARKHSQDMAARNYFEHDDPERHDFYWRMQQEGYNCEIAIGNTIYEGAENIYLEEGYSADAIASTAVNGWMSSAGHRANILTPYWENEGIGIAKSGDGTIYITQDFC